MSNNKGFVYEWTNKITGKKYIGSHHGSESDSYVGSGVGFLKDLKLYGILNYDRKILEYVTDENDLKEAEQKWLNLVDAKNNSDYLNRSNHGSGSRVLKKNSDKRPICPHCNIRHRAVAYHRNEKTYYRSKCDACIRRGRKQKPAKPRWELAGYKKKLVCDRCGFRAKHAAQTLVYHVDGNLNNNNLNNLKTICLNCTVEIKRLDLPWKRGDLEADH